MVRNAIESDFRSSKMAAAAILWRKIKVAYWCEMARNAICHQNGRRQPFCEKIEVAYFSEMARNAIEIHFRSSKMGGGGGMTMARL